MQVFWGANEVPAEFGPSAVTIGKFDGVHAGHRAVIRKLRAVAKESGLLTTVVTFDRNPLSLVAPGRSPRPLASNDEKVDLLEETGVDATLFLTFDEHFASEQAEEFVTEILVAALKARVVFVGADFRFGAGGRGTVELLRELGDHYGFEVRLIDEVVFDGTRRVSSTWIREVLSTGDVAGAAALLERLPMLRSTVVHGQMRGRELGYPTANLAPDIEGFIPGDGVYAAWATIAGTRYAAAVSIGNNPTFDGVPQKQVEAYLIDQDLDLYDQRIQLEFVEYVRGMVKFDSIEELITQMRDDTQRAREILHVAPWN